MVGPEAVPRSLSCIPVGLAGGRHLTLRNVYQHVVDTSLGDDATAVGASIDIGYRSKYIHAAFEFQALTRTLYNWPSDAGDCREKVAFSPE